MGHRRAGKLVEQYPNFYDVIMISNPDGFFAVEHSANIPKYAKNHLQLAFHDISIPRAGLQEVQPEHIKQALEFAEDKKELIVACQAGISRSSAIAYSIKTKEVGPISALEILDPYTHQPNSLVIKLASKILNQPDMVELINIWKNKASALECENPNWQGIK